MKILRAIHTGYGLVVFAVLFAILLPLLLLPMIFPGLHAMVGWINRWWARLLFLFVFLPFRAEYRAKLRKSQIYIFCPNHFSYLDIPTLGLNTINTLFVGKSEMEKIPLFGFMYRKLHITVNRSSLRSRGETMKRSLAAIDEGKSLVIFPEGGIVTERDPIMSRFKDGAFRVAIEKQIPIVPVTIPYNWIILPPDQFLLRWHPIKVIFHEPLETRGMTLENLSELKGKVFEIINAELANHIN
jgi:1-acyl-sn-glycerol-3-phosphate acyltransferase